MSFLYFNNLPSFQFFLDAMLFNLVRCCVDIKSCDYEQSFYTLDLLALISLFVLLGSCKI